MRVWTDGERTWIVHPTGVDVFAGEKFERRRDLWPAPKRGENRFWKRDVLAMVDATTAWVGRDGAVRVISIEGGDAIDVDAYVLDAIGIGGGRVLACVALPGQLKAELLIVDGADPDIESAKRISIPAMSAVPWPEFYFVAGKEPFRDKEWEEGDEPMHLDAIAIDHVEASRAWTDNAVAQKRAAAATHPQFDRVVLSSSPFGLALVSTYAGAVLVLEPDASSVRFAFRVPAESDAETFATATESGVLITHTHQGKHSAIYHLARDGSRTGGVVKVGKEILSGAGPALVDADRAVVFESGNKRLHELHPTTVEVKRSRALDHATTGEPSIAGTPARLTLGLGDKAVVVETGKKIKERVLEAPPPPPVATLPPPVPRKQGTPALAVSSPVVTWTTRVGEPLTIELTVENRGGPMRGVHLELGGPGAETVELGEAMLGDHTLAAANGRHESAKVTLDAGFEDLPKGVPAPRPPAVVGRVVLVPRKPGSGIVTLRISPLNTPGRGSGLLGRTITITSE